MVFHYILIISLFKTCSDIHTCHRIHHMKLYAIFIAPLFEIEKLTYYADDGLGLVWNKDRQELVNLMERKLDRIDTWLKKSGMKVNEGKTCLCLFHKNDTPPIEIKLNGVTIRSKTSINVLGVIFDQKLQWSEHISQCINKSSKALNAIRLIRRFFTTKELLQIVTSNYFSILYYNSEIWHLPTLKNNLKQKILSSSAKAIRTCVKYCTKDISFIRLHEMYNRATPEKYLLYKHALCLFKLINSTAPHNFEWLSLNFNMIFTSRQTTFMTIKDNTKRVGLNALANRVSILNGKIPLAWFNFTLETFKVKCKKEFLS